MALEPETHFGEAINFFVYDTIKVFFLLSVIIFVVAMIRSYFPPEKTSQTHNHQVEAASCIRRGGRRGARMVSPAKEHWRTRQAHRGLGLAQSRSVLQEHAHGRRQRGHELHHFCGVLGVSIVGNCKAFRFVVSAQIAVMYEHRVPH
jgi:hypothetical protein